jgi:hypothetical protein
MTEENIKEFFYSINSLNLNKKQKKRILQLFQVRGINKKNKVMTYCEFKKILLNRQGKITSLVLGPKWNRLVFADIDIEL